MELSKRMKTVASLVTAGSRLADIGTDHGYLPIALVRSGIVPCALAMDVNEGPLLRAKEHIRQYQLEDKIITRRSDGLSALERNEADSIVIAGMGGALVIHIMENAKIHWDSIKEWILQPQSELDKVRFFLQQNQFKIIQEEMILEDGKYYPMMKVIKGEMEPLNEVDALFGRELLKNKNEVLYQYLIELWKKRESLKNNLEKQGSDHAIARSKELAIEMNWIREALTKYESK